MRRDHQTRLAGFSLVFLVLMSGSALAGFIDFENGYDQQVIFSSITGLEFTNTAGYDWLYGDWRTNDYNGKYPNYAVVYDPIWPRPLATQYYSDGNFFAWMGTDQGMGVITFTQSYATYFQVGYSTYSGITLRAYDENGNILDTDVGVLNNTGTGRLDIVRVDAPGMAYVTIIGTNNQWLIDNLDTDAIQQCTTNEQCDDGDYCNGVESCIQYQCVDGDPVVCEDDGLYCNGTETCSNEELGCVHSGDPCAEGTTCNEETDACDSPPPDDDVADDTEPGGNLESDDTGDPPPTSDEEGWPKGKVTGGCCGG